MCIEIDWQPTNETCDVTGYFKTTITTEQINAVKNYFYLNYTFF